MAGRISVTRQVPQAGIDLLTSVLVNTSWGPVIDEAALAGRRPGNLVNPRAWWEMS